MNTNSALFLLSGAIGMGLVLSLPFSLLFWRGGQAFPLALRNAAFLCFSIAGTMFLLLLALGAYENWRADAAAMTRQDAHE